MKYTIWSIDDSRNHYVDAIKSICPFEQIEVNCIDGSNLPILNNEISSRELYEFYFLSLKRGELGVWFTLINTLEKVVELNENLLVFEDDAILHPDFEIEFNRRFEQVPDDFHFFSLFIPRDHDAWFEWEAEIDHNGVVLKGQATHIGPAHNHVNGDIYKVWSRYGGVSMVWSPAGARAMLRLIKDKPHGQWDEFSYCSARLGKLNGYVSDPRLSDLVKITGKEKSLVHE